MSRRRRPLRRALVTLLVLAGLLLAADRGAAWWAQQYLAQRLQPVLKTSARPVVSIEGFPFLTQAGQRRLQQVHVDAAQPTVSGVRLGRLRADLLDVVVDPSAKTARTARLTGRADTTYEQLTRQTSVPFSYAGGGRLRATYRAEVMGEQVTLVLTARPQLDAATQTVTLASPELSVDGIALPPDLSAELLSGRARPIKVPLPASLRATGVVVDADGLGLSVEGRDVELTSLG